MKLPAYPKTKPSGVEWLGDVPEHWEVKRLSYLAMLKSGENITSEMIAEGGDYPVYGGNGFRGNYHQFTHRGHYALIGRQGALCGNINYASGEFWASEHALVVLPLKEFAVVWMGELLRAMNLGQYSVTAAQPGIAAEMIRGLRIPVPTLAEQRSIAAFLDRETGRVDRLVGKKRELIERLKEKRTALISRTVTRGLPPAAAKAAGLPANPPLKPSALDWLGDIPKHWEVKPVKFVAQIGNGSTPSRDNPNYWEDGGYPWLNSSVVNQESITEAEEFVTTLALRECHLPQIAPPAVLVGITGQGRTRGMASTLMFEATINQHVAYLKPHPSRAEVGFLRRVFDMVYLFLRSESDGGGSTKGAITCEQIANLKIPLPPLREQAAIAAYLDAETAKLDALVGKVTEAVERLQEYRTALITAAVTGKIDVRKASA